MSVDIDWAWVLINSSIIKYLNKYEVVELSLGNKRIRAKLYPLIFNNLIINNNVLFRQSNYFQHEIYYQFNNFSRIEKFSLFRKYGFNRDLAFKESQIDPFIKQANKQLKSYAIHSKSLSFECLGKACYYLLQISLEFANLRGLSVNMCVISLNHLNNVLARLKMLEVLDLKSVDLITSTDSNLTNNIILPQNLREFTYVNTKSGSTSLPDLKPLQFLTVNNSIDIRSSHPLVPQLLPKLTKLNYFNTFLVANLMEFLIINNQIDDLSLPKSYLVSIKTNLELVKNLKKLKLYAKEFQSKQLTIENDDIPNFPNLLELKLNLRTGEEMEFAKLLILKCPKLIKLNVISSNFKLERLKDLAKLSNSLKFFNDEIL